MLMTNYLRYGAQLTMLPSNRLERVKGESNKKFFPYQHKFLLPAGISEGFEI